MSCPVLGKKSHELCVRERETHMSSTHMSYPALPILIHLVKNLRGGFSRSRGGFSRSRGGFSWSFFFDLSN